MKTETSSEIYFTTSHLLERFSLAQLVQTQTCLFMLPYNLQNHTYMLPNLNRQKRYSYQPHLVSTQVV